MVERDIGSLLECESISTVCGIEHTVDEYTVDVEIGFHLIITYIELLFLHLSRIVEPVVGLELEVASLGLACEFLDGMGLGVSLWFVLCDEALEKVINVLGCLGHGVLQGIFGIICITHQLAFFRPQFGNLADDGIGVVIACAI